MTVSDSVLMSFSFWCISWLIRTAVTAGGCSRNHLIMSHQDSSHCWWVLQESPDHVSSGQQSLLVGAPGITSSCLIRTAVTAGGCSRNHIIMSHQDSSHCWWVLQESHHHVVGTVQRVATSNTSLQCWSCNSSCFLVKSEATVMLRWKNATILLILPNKYLSTFFVYWFYLATLAPAIPCIGGILPVSSWSEFFIRSLFLI